MRAKKMFYGDFSKEALDCLVAHAAPDAGTPTGRGHRWVAKALRAAGQQYPELRGLTISQARRLVRTHKAWRAEPAIPGNLPSRPLPPPVPMPSELPPNRNKMTEVMAHLMDRVGQRGLDVIINAQKVASFMITQGITGDKQMTLDVLAAATWYFNRYS